MAITIRSALSVFASLTISSAASPVPIAVRQSSRYVFYRSRKLLFGNFRRRLHIFLLSHEGEASISRNDASNWSDDMHEHEFSFEMRCHLACDVERFERRFAEIEWAEDDMNRQHSRRLLRLSRYFIQNAKVPRHRCLVRTEVFGNLSFGTQIGEVR